jgi:predicted NUDIX family phosphoesterase
MLTAFGQFMDRDKAEKNVDWKQVIPYVVMRCGDKVMSYVRGSQGNEKRLTDCRSVGIGGHVNPWGPNPLPLTSFVQSVDREVEEEVLIDTKHRGQAVALLNDDSTAVGRVHLGVVFLWHLNMPRVKSREAGKVQDIQWAKVPVLLNSMGRLESWTRIVLERDILDLS